MENFFTSLQGRWPAGREDYHWHVLPDPALIREHLAIPYRELVDRPGLAPVPAIWAHVTVQHFAPVAEVGREDIASIADRVRRQCRDVAAFELTVRRPEVWSTGLVCPVWPGELTRNLWSITTSAGKEVTGDRFAIVPATYDPHLALAYCVSRSNDAALRRWLSDHDVPELTFMVDRLSLVAQRHTEREIVWRHIDTVMLRTDPADQP